MEKRPCPNKNYDALENKYWEADKLSFMTLGATST